MKLPHKVLEGLNVPKSACRTLLATVNTRKVFVTVHCRILIKKQTNTCTQSQKWVTNYLTGYSYIEYNRINSSINRNTYGVSEGFVAFLTLLNLFMYDIFTTKISDTYKLSYDCHITIFNQRPQLKQQSFIFESSSTD